ncbi:MAG TPA: hypothetical protein VLF94_02090 [Chlamydiales bacterium]|nr:hypothetical protein [Chlamydiales bacterium]
MNVSISPVVPSRERKPEGGGFGECKPIDSKVRGVVLERISRARGGLLPSAMAPQIVIDLLPAFELAKREHARPKRKSKLRKVPLAKNVPIGLRPADPEGWIDSLMQFILFVPGFVELFYFSPRSFEPFQEFIDQYHHDQQENRNPSSANSAALYCFLKARLTDFCFHGIFQYLIRVLHPKWEVQKNLEEALQKGCPPDLFVTESEKKQHFVQPDLCYDLDAFIEMRPDGGTASFITYVKMDGGWYQCDTDRITQLRSNCLNAPLHRAILLHYKRMVFTKSGWL